MWQQAEPSKYWFCSRDDLVCNTTAPKSKKFNLKFCLIKFLISCTHLNSSSNTEPPLSLHTARVDSSVNWKGNNKLEIWPQRPRSFAAAIAMQYVGVACNWRGVAHQWGGGCIIGVAQFMGGCIMGCVVYPWGIDFGLFLVDGWWGWHPWGDQRSSCSRNHWSSNTICAFLKGVTGLRLRQCSRKGGVSPDPTGSW